MKTEQDYQRVYAGINLDAVMHNLEKMHTLIKDDTKIIAVIKTDGYGPVSYTHLTLPTT